MTELFACTGPKICCRESSRLKIAGEKSSPARSTGVCGGDPWRATAALDCPGLAKPQHAKASKRSGHSTARVSEAMACHTESASTYTALPAA